MLLRVTDEERQKIAELWPNMTTRAIAKRLGRPVATVFATARRLRLPPHPSAPRQRRPRKGAWAGVREPDTQEGGEEDPVLSEALRQMATPAGYFGPVAFGGCGRGVFFLFVRDWVGVGRASGMLVRSLPPRLDWVDAGTWAGRIAVACLAYVCPDPPTVRALWPAAVQWMAEQRRTRKYAGVLPAWELNRWVLETVRELRAWEAA